jgi:hypothetical protein
LLCQKLLILHIADGFFVIVVGTLGMMVPASGGIGAYHFAMKLGIEHYSFPLEVLLNKVQKSDFRMHLFLILYNYLLCLQWDLFLYQCWQKPEMKQ